MDGLEGVQCPQQQEIHWKNTEKILMEKNEVEEEEMEMEGDEDEEKLTHYQK